MLRMTLDLPRLGDALPTPAHSDDAIRRLSRRRSCPAQALSAPGPDDAAVIEMIALAARSPDHGKLAPWRFVILSAETRAELGRRLEPFADTQPKPDKARAVLAKLVNPPATVMVVSTPTPDHKVPVWEQELSAGAVCMNLIHAADAMGWSANWITDWYSYAAEAVGLFGVGEGERIAGFIHLGTAAEPPLERARPDPASLTTRL